MFHRQTRNICHCFGVGQRTLCDIGNVTMRGDAHEGRRVVLPNEQHTHSFLEAGPFMAVSFTSCLYWEQFFALLGLGNERPRFELRPRQKPLSRNYIIGILTAIALTVALPYAEEFWRCYRADKTIAPLPETRVPGVFAGEEHSSQAWRLSYHKKRVSDMACHVHDTFLWRAALHGDCIVDGEHDGENNQADC